MIPIVRSSGRPSKSLVLDLPGVHRFLVTFLQDEVQRRKGFEKVVVALSGGLDSSLTCYLCAHAFGADNVIALPMPYATSSEDSLTHAQLVIDDLGIAADSTDITAAVDGYCKAEPTMTAHRKGNVMARVRMLVMFDKAYQYNALPVGTSNKTERLFGYYTWHDAADAAPVNPLGDLFKTQVRALAVHVGVPEVIVAKPPSADLLPGQSDEDDLGISYEKADSILAHYLAGYEDAYLLELDYSQQEIDLVRSRVNRTHWKRALPISAMISNTAINEYYLRPVDY